MARDARISTHSARKELKGGPDKRHWRPIHKGLALGYRRGRKGRGSWLVRQLIGTAYEVAVIGIADDLDVADGITVLNFQQAQKRALDRAGISSGPLSVEEAVKRYVSKLTAEKGDTASEDARQRLHKHALPSLGREKVGELTLTRLQRWRDALVDRDGDNPISRATANRVMANLKAALNNAFKDEKNGIASDKAWRVLEAFKNTTKARTDHFEADKTQRLIDAARKIEPEFADLLTGGWFTGARYGELVACDVRHFDAGHGVLNIPSGKTGARPVTLTGDAIAFLGRLTKARDAEAPLFHKADGTRWAKSEQHRRIKAALKAAKLPSSASFYSLRHSYISRAVEDDVPLFIIARNCGTSEKMIRQHYAHLIASKERAMLERAAKAMRLQVIEGGRKTA